MGDDISHIYFQEKTRMKSKRVKSKKNIGLKISNPNVHVCGRACDWVFMGYQVIGTKFLQQFDND